MSKKRIYSYLTYLLSAFSLSLWFFYFSSVSGAFSISFFDVGNGDGFLIQTPENFKIVIDGGPTDKILEKIGIRNPFSKKEIDLLVLTHPHEDHVYGSLEIVRNFKVKNVLVTGVEHNNKTYKEFLSNAKDYGAEIIHASYGQTFKLGETEVSVLYPFYSLEGKKDNNINETSIVLKLVYGKFECLFLGDLEEKVGLEMLRQGVDLSADVVKVSHQGSKNGAQNLPFFLERVNPKIAIISVGKNSFGHPHKKTLDRLSSFGADILRTDIAGDITIKSDGEKFWMD